MSRSHIIHDAPAGGEVTSMPLRAEAITPSDATVYELGRTIIVGTAGDVVVEPYVGGNTVTFKVGGDGGVIPVVVRRVLATGTTASDMVGVY